MGEEEEEQTILRIPTPPTYPPTIPHIHRPRAAPVCAFLNRARGPLFPLPSACILSPHRISEASRPSRCFLDCISRSLRAPRQKRGPLRTSQTFSGHQEYK